MTESVARNLQELVNFPSKFSETQVQQMTGYVLQGRITFQNRPLNSDHDM
jgi:uncharacterized lipoprotein YbaY